MRFWFIGVLLCQILAGGEIRAYRVGLDSFQIFGLGNQDADFDFKNAKKMVKSPFESRFFTKGGALLDCTERVMALGFFDESKGQAVYDVSTGRLVVRADETKHAFLYDLLAGSLETQMQVKLVLRKVPIVRLGPGDFQNAEGEVVASLAGVSVSGRTMTLRSADQKVTMESEFQGGEVDSSDWECRLDLKSLIPGAKVEFRSGLSGLFGKPTTLGLGSLDGESTLVTEISVDQIFADGSLFVDWVVQEDGQGVVEKRRLAKLRDFGRHRVDFGNGRGYELFTVPPTFWTFLQGANGASKSLRELLMDNGVGLKKEDRVFQWPGGSLFAVEASRESLELIYGIVMPAGQFGPPPILTGSYSLLESKTKLSGDDLRRGDFRILKKISTPGFGGQSTTVELGGEKLKAESELQTTSSDDLVEARFTVGGKRVAKLAGVFDGDVGVPIIIRQEKAGEHWRSWVAVFSVQRVDEMVKVGR